MTDFSVFFPALAQKSLAGEALSRDAALAVIQADDGHLRELLSAAFTVRERFFGRKVKVCVLQNAQSGLCRKIATTAHSQKFRLRRFRSIACWPKKS